MLGNQGAVMALRPSWEVYHRLGEQVSKDLEPNCTYEEIGASMGTSKQKAYHETMVALGKLVYALRMIHQD